MVKSKKPESEMTDAEYLVNSIQVFEEMIGASLEQIKTLKKEIDLLQEDIKVIKSERLKKGAMEAHNKLTMQKSGHLKKIKAIRGDLKHARSLLKKIKGLENKVKEK